MVPQLAEILLTQTEQRSAIEFGISTDVVVRVRMKRPAVLVLPGLLRVVLRLDVDGPRAPVVLLTWHVVAALEQQDPLARRREVIGEGAAAGTGADDDYVVMRHTVTLSSLYPHLKMHGPCIGWWSFAQ